jgi:hypothetical protein
VATSTTALKIDRIVFVSFSYRFATVNDTFSYRFFIETCKKTIRNRIVHRIVTVSFAIAG